MNVLMFGWEFPPLSSGGLGTACYGLTKGLSNNHVGIIFVVPSSMEIGCDFARIISTGIIKIRKIDSIITPYMTSENYRTETRSRPFNAIYGSDLFKEVHRYTALAARIAKEEEYDIIHCHDWMTFPAGIEAKKVSKKPLVVHVHATEFDRTGGNGINEHIYSVEKKGMDEADLIIAVSNFTKSKIIQHYHINPDKIRVVHNAVDFKDCREETFEIKKYDKLVLFLGRITLQKGPDYFLYVAKKVLEYQPNVKFIMAGTGDMEHFIMEKAAELGIGKNVLFAGFLKGNDIDKAYQMADVYVMPSVSEPFGITPLEAMRNKTPVIISKQSGVSEVITHCLKADFWDIDEMANKILAVLNYTVLHQTLKDGGLGEIKRFTWDKPARECLSLYRGLLGGGA
ncbi:MAG: glycosyltransferase family 4 protein [archaeon]